jgi:hypothetical protein
MFAVAKIVNMNWTDNEIQFLKNNYSENGTNYCINSLNRTKSSILGMATNLKLKAKKPNSYSKDELKFLKNNYSSHGVEYCMIQLGRTKEGICTKAHELNQYVDAKTKSLNIINTRKINNYIKYDVNNIINVSNKYVAYFLGYLWADGNLINKSAHLTTINLIKEDAEYLYNILNLIGSGWTIGREIKKYWKNSAGEIKQAKNQRIIRCYSQELYNFLSENDYENKSHINFKKIWNKIPENFKNFFILGLYDGDGHFNYQFRHEKYHSGEFVITANYDYDWSVLENYFNENNIEYSIYRLIVKLGRVSQFIVRKKKSLIILFKKLYEDEFHGLERKYIKYLNYYEKIKFKG